LILSKSLHVSGAKERVSGPPGGRKTEGRRSCALEIVTTFPVMK
jgi:hypothetical protein